MVNIIINGHDYDDDFYEIIKKFFPKEELNFTNTVADLKGNSISFISSYDNGLINTVILLPQGKEIFNEEINLSQSQQEDEHTVRYELIKSLITGINRIKF